MLDEALDVLFGLWTGEPFSYQGAHYRIDNVRFLPPPVQTPRIPVWVGGQWPRRGPMERAARCDGFVGHKVHGPEEPWLLTPDDVRELLAFVEARRTQPTPFDVVMGGAARGPDWDRERETIRSLARAGATWWAEYVPVGGLDAMRAAIAAGPLRVE
jgi:hypothetical protein